MQYSFMPPKNMPPKKASKSVIASYDTSNIPTPLKISGKRPPSVLSGSHQGDHVTAYRLVEEGLYNAISNLSEEEITGLSFLNNRNSLRSKRSKLYNFISVLGSLEVSDNRVILYNVIDEMLAKYQEARGRKTDLRDKTRVAQENVDLDEGTLKGVLSGIDASYKLNGGLLQNFFTEASRYLLTFYNKIPGTAYFAIKEFEAPAGEGSKVSTSIRGIKEQMAKIGNIEKNSPALTIKLNRDIIPLVLNLIHYPQITHKDGKTAEEILGEHRANTLTDGGRTAVARDNDENKLGYALARHIHLTFAAFPDLPKIFSVKDFSDSFVSAFIKDERTGWPGYNNDANIPQISDNVWYQLNIMKKATNDNHYTKREKYTEELLSSDDEEEVTTPSPRNHEISPSIELEQLRKYHQIMSKAIEDGDLILPENIREELVEKCPAIALSKPKYKISSKGETSGGEENESENETESSSQESESSDDEPAKPKKSIKNAVAMGVQKSSNKKGRK